MNIFGPMPRVCRSVRTGEPARYLDSPLKHLKRTDVLAQQCNECGYYHSEPTYRPPQEGDDMNTRQTRVLTHRVINDLHLLAKQIDADYHEECADSCNTNPPPVNDAQQTVRLLNRVAMVLNGSGLGDSGHFEQFSPFDA
jgi:hypothetical protein